MTMRLKVLHIEVLPAVFVLEVCIFACLVMVKNNCIKFEYVVIAFFSIFIA